MPAVGLRRGGGGARREISSRITLVAGGAEHDGWALNISRGGIRVVIEGRVELGQEYEVRDLDPDIAEGGPFMARVVWVQDEPDGAIVGLEFVGPEIPKLVERPASVHPPASPSVQPPAPPPPPPPAPPAEPVMAGPSQPAPRPEPSPPNDADGVDAGWTPNDPNSKG